jgi:hypothetical protein
MDKGPPVLSPVLRSKKRVGARGTLNHWRASLKKPSSAAASKAASILVGKRYAKMSPEERSQAASHAASAPWEDMNAEQRKAEMKRRLAGKGKAKRAAR